MADPICDCCGATHPYGIDDVDLNWRPALIRHLVIGESPAAGGAAHFYDRTPVGKPDRVPVRRVLLGALHASGWIAAPSLAAFKEADFFYDYAIRCRLPVSEIEQERELAGSFSARLEGRTQHLRPLIDEADHVWAMGALARQAVIDLDPEMPRRQRPLDPPYSEEGVGSIVVSRDFSGIGPARAQAITEAVRDLMRIVPALPEAATELSIAIGGHFGPSYRLNGHGRYLVYEAYRAGALQSKWKLLPTADQWLELWRELDRLDAWSWKKHYENPGILDGTSWHIRVSDGQRTLRTSGENNKPDQAAFAAFCGAIRNLIGGLDFN